MIGILKARTGSSGSAQHRPQASKRPDDELPSWGFEESDEIAPGRFALRLLGGGSRYEAYLAYDETLLTTVVVKVLRPHRAADPVTLEGLAAEERMLRALDHPVIMRCFDAVLSGPRPHLMLELVDGPRLSRLLRRHGPLPMEQLVPLAVEMCAALHYMHGRDIVHLDLKPGNVVMSAPPRLIDFSIARSQAQARRLDEPVGTDPYMAPEQCDPSGGGSGPAADVWGLGATLFEAATGELPFGEGDPDADDLEARFPQVATPPVPIRRDLPPHLVNLLHHCLSPNPADRPLPAELAEALEPLVAALPRRPVLSRFKPKLR